MHGIQRRQSEMLQRVRQVGVNHEDALSTSAPAQQLLAAVGTALDDLTATDVKKLSASVAKRGQQKADARRKLIDLLQKGGQLARVLRADGHTLPPCDLPASKSDQALRTAARELAANAATFAAEFGDHELPSSRITAVTAAFETAVSNRSAARADYVAAATRIDALLKGAVRQARRLDLIVGALLADDATALAEWELARRVEEVRGPRKPRHTANPEIETPPAAAAGATDNAAPPKAA
jgi:hypothetical protein